MKTLPPAPRCFGFTLIELLTVIGIVGVLAAVAFPVYSKVQNSASSVTSVSNLRQIGAAIQLYANDHDSTLPGPLWGSQSGSYVSGETVYFWSEPPEYAGGSLLVFIAPYLGFPVTGTKQYTNIFMYPAFVPYARKNSGAPPYLMGRIAANDTSTVVAPSTYDPWGYPSSNTTPMRLAGISALGALSNLAAMVETDQKVPGSTPGDGWWSQAPTQPVHGNGRNVLYFDWHVGRMDANSKTF